LSHFLVTVEIALVAPWAHDPTAKSLNIQVGIWPPNWSVGFEYDRLFMGSRDVNLTGVPFSETEHIKQDVDIGLVRLNYRFGGYGGIGAPVAARY
jgi:hypothetical protein